MKLKEGHYYKSDAYTGGNSNPIIFNIASKAPHRHSGIAHLYYWRDSTEIPEEMVALEILRYDL